MSPQELLEANGIKLESHNPGRYYSVCPHCSAGRSRAHQNSECLGITIDADGARWGCNHCGWTGPEKGSGNGRDAKFEAMYDYIGFQKVRYPKGHEPRFRIRHANGDGGWKWGAGDADTNVLYRR